MRIKTFILSLIILFVMPILSIAEDPPVTGPLSIDELSSARVGRFPSSWRTWPFQRGKASEIYKVEQENGQKFIRAFDNKDYSVQIMRNFNWPLDKYPYLSWKWRARELPKGAREDNDDTNDSACGVYVIFGRTSGHALKYVWSTGLPVGKVVSRLDGKLKIHVADTGSAQLNQWRSHTIDVPKDYAAVFGRAPGKNPPGIALLTDANATHTSASCDYTGFSISKEPLK